MSPSRQSPPLPLIIGIPGSDSVEHLTLQGVNSTMRTVILLKVREYWGGVDVRRDGPLAALFAAAPAEWEGILRVWRRDLGSAALKDTTPPFRCLTYLFLSRGSQLARHLEDIAGPIGGGDLFPALRTFHDRRTTTLLGPMPGISHEDVNTRWLVHLSHVERLMIDVTPLTSSSYTAF